MLDCSLALAEMKTPLRDVYSDYGTTPHVSMTEEAMTMSDQLISSRPLDSDVCFTSIP